MALEQSFTSLKKYFGRGTFAQILKDLPKLQSPIMDMMYPESRRRQWPSALIPLGKITKDTGAMPVVRRGGASYSVEGQTGNIQLLDPQPISLNDFATAAEINDILSTGLESNVEAFVADKIDGLRRDTRNATEIMCGQTLGGSVSYKLARADGSLEAYIITYGGNIQSLDDKDISAANIGTIIKHLEEMHRELAKYGYTGKVIYLCGDDVYARIITVVTSANTAPVVWNSEGLLLAGKYQIMPAGWTYTLPGETSGAYYVDPKFVMALDLNAPHTLLYTALDDMDANLAPLPFYAKPKISDDPSGVKIISQSKPLPAPVLKAICKRRFLPA